MPLTPNQTLAVQTVDRPVAVIAGAGSGKTRVLIERYRYLVTDCGVPLHKILAFTFTEKAAGEIKERIFRQKVIKPEEEGLARIGTIHAFCNRLLRNHGPLLRLDPAFTVLNETDAQITCEARIKSHLIQMLKNRDPLYEEWCQRFGFAKLGSIFHKLVSEPHLYDKPSDDQPLLLETSRFFHAWLEEKITSASLTFDDLEFLTARLLREHPEVTQKLRQRFLHVMVDEFQDTSPLQAEIIRGLTQTGVNYLFIVGDPKQSIYRFRHADVSSFNNIVREIDNNGGLVVSLDETFRIPPRLTDGINKICSPLFTEEEGGPLYHPLIAMHHEQPGRLQTVVAPTDKLPIDKLRQLEARWIAKFLKEQNLSPNEREQTALLFRSGKSMAIYREELEKAGIPTQVTRSHHLLDEPIIRDLLHILAYLAGHSKLLVQAGIMRSPLFALSEAFIERYIRTQPSDFLSPYTPDLFTTPSDQEKWDRLTSLISRWEKLKNALAPSKLFRLIADDLEIPPGLGGFIEQWLSLIDEIESTENLTLLRLHEMMETVRHGNNEIGVLDFKTQSGCVQLMTIHAAKGLEFRRVFLPQLYASVRGDGHDFLFNTEKGVAFKKKPTAPIMGLKNQLEETPFFKELKELEDKESREELKRLLYVALTRSKEDLILFLKDPKKKIKIAESKNWNEWLWTLLEKEREEVIQLSPKGDSEEGSERWSGLASKLEEVLSSQTSDVIARNEATKQSHTLSANSEDRHVAPKNGAPRDDKHSINHKPTYTVSEIETFLRCEKEYELRYVYGIRPTAEIPPNPPFSKGGERGDLARVPPQQWGLLIHEIMQFLDFKTLANEETVIEQALTNQQIDDTDGEIRKRVKALLVQMKEDEASWQALSDSHSSYTELPFLLDGNDYFLRGTLDRLFCHEDNWIVLDYKTDRINSPEELLHRITAYGGQMACYALAASEITQSDSMKSVLFFTDGPAWTEKAWNPSDLEKVKEKLLELHRSIREKRKANQFAYPDDLTVCRHCAYFEGNYCGVKTLKIAS